jgi:hypothetical protein
MTDREAFLLARAGSLGASEIADILRAGRGGEPSASRKNMVAKKVVERLTGRPIVGFVSRAMQDGLDREAEAKRLFMFLTDHEVLEVPAPGVIPHPKIAGAHASPDGLIGIVGRYEGKAPEPAQHLAMWETDKVAPDYLTQMQFQMAATGRRWCAFASYCPVFPSALQMWITYVNRDEKRIAELEAAARVFVEEVTSKVETLKRRIM